MSAIAAKRYDRGMWLLENGRLQQLRRALLRQVKGEVLEIGVGTGANLPLYNGVSRLTAVDIHWGRLQGAVEKGEAENFSYTVSQSDAQRLPFPANQFDAVVGTLVFCSIPRPDLALAEIRRVLKPDGRLFLLEHVRGQGSISRRLTDWLHPTWFALQGECHLNRDTAVAVADAGFAIQETSVHGWGVLQMITATM